MFYLICGFHKYGHHISSPYENTKEPHLTESVETFVNLINSYNVNYKMFSDSDVKIYSKS